MSIAATRWPNDISSAADNSIFKNRALNIACSFGCVARRAFLLKPNVANILLFTFCEQKFAQHGAITIAFDCNGLSLLIFEEKSAPNNDSFSVCLLFNVCVRVLCAPNATIFLVYISTKIKMSFIWKDDFFCQNRHLLWVARRPTSQHCSNIYTTIFVRRKDKTNYLTWAKYYIHTYIIGHYNPPIRIIDLVSLHHLC